MRSSVLGGQEDTEAGEGELSSSWELSYVESSEPDPRLTAAECDEARHLHSAPSQAQCPGCREPSLPPSLLRACVIRASHAHSLQNRLSWQQARQDGLEPGGRAGTSPWEHLKQTHTGTVLAPGSWHLSHHLPCEIKHTDSHCRARGDSQVPGKAWSGEDLDARQHPPCLLWLPSPAAI